MEPWLYIVLLGAAVVVYARIVPAARSSSRETSVIKEIEDTMEQFSAELEEENRQLLELVAGMKKEHEVHTARLQGRIEALERQNRDVSRQLDQLLRSEGTREPRPVPTSDSQRADSSDDRMVAPPPASADIPQAAPDADKPGSPAGQLNIRERYADLFRLERQGKSTEYIAKKLGMNKGEVMLIMQLARQEEQSRD